MRRVTNRDIERRERDRYEAARDAYAASRDINRLARDTEGLPEKAVEIIRDRLKIAARLIERIVGRVGPRGYGSSWPAVLKEAADWFDVERDDAGNPTGFRMIDRDQRPILQPTARQISQAEEALGWRRYVAGVELEVLNIWLWAQARRRPWQQTAIEAGFARETAKRRLSRAFYLIAVGLCRDRLPIEEPRR